MGIPPLSAESGLYRSENHYLAQWSIAFPSVGIRRLGFRNLPSTHPRTSTTCTTFQSSIQFQRRVLLPSARKELFNVRRTVGVTSTRVVHLDTLNQLRALVSAARCASVYLPTFKIPTLALAQPVHKERSCARKM